MIMPRIAVCQYLASLSFNQLRIYCCGCVIKDPEYSVPVMMALVWLITALIQSLIDFVGTWKQKKPVVKYINNSDEAIM
jgi:hypothetical protein